MPRARSSRGDVSAKKLALVFAGGDHAESTGPILDVLKERNIRAGFFVTGDFARRPELRQLLNRIVSEGHYLGPHSDSHPLYCDWKDRRKTLVTKEFFADDLTKNLAVLRALGALPFGERVYFIPPYEWFNASRCLVPRDGHHAHQFHARQRLEPRLRTGRRPGLRSIAKNLRRYPGLRADRPHGFNGFLLLLHLGSGRQDPFHTQLRALCDELTRRGYEFERVDSLCRP